MNNKIIILIKRTTNNFWDWISHTSKFSFREKVFKTRLCCKLIEILSSNSW